MTKNIILWSFLLLVFSCKSLNNQGSKVLSEREKASLRDSLDKMMLESIASLASAHNDSSFIARVNANHQNLTTSPSIALTTPFSNLGDQLRQKLIKVWKNAGSSTCNILRPYVLKASKNRLRHPYFFVGTAVNAGAGLHVVKGKDIVWDFYNAQASSFHYQGKEAIFGASSIGAGVSTYAGIAFGHKPDVRSAWSGRFISARIEVSLPLLANYISLGGSSFSSATTNIADMQIIGVNISVQGGLSIPNPLPGSLGIQIAEWSPDLKTNTHISKILKTKNIAHRTTGPESCSGTCLSFIKPERTSSSLNRTTGLLSSIPLLAVNSGDSPYFPRYPELAVLAYATTLYKEVSDVDQACNFI